MRIDPNNLDRYQSPDARRTTSSAPTSAMASSIAGLNLRYSSRLPRAGASPVPASPRPRVAGGLPAPAPAAPRAVFGPPPAAPRRPGGAPRGVDASRVAPGMTYVKATPRSLGLAVGVHSRLHSVKDVLRELARIFGASHQYNALPRPASVNNPPSAAPPQRPANYDPFVPDNA